MQIGQIISQTLFLWSLSSNYNFGADNPQLFTFCKLSSTSTTGWLAGLQNVKEEEDLEKLQDQQNIKESDFAFSL